jgi:hypothetical protein
MDDDVEFDTDSTVTLPDDAKDAKHVKLTPDMVADLMTTATLQSGAIKNKRGVTKPVVSRAKRVHLRKLQKVARRVTRGTTKSNAGRQMRINHPR